MNAPSKVDRGRTTVFRLNRSQAVRIPKDLEFPEGVKNVHVIRVGKRLELIPVGALWDDFFDREPNPDFPEREQPPVQERDFGF